MSLVVPICAERGRESSALQEQLHGFSTSRWQKNTVCLRKTVYTMSGPGKLSRAWQKHSWFDPTSQQRECNINCSDSYELFFWEKIVMNLWCMRCMPTYWCLVRIWRVLRDLILGFYSKTSSVDFCTIITIIHSYKNMKKMLLHTCLENLFLIQTIFRDYKIFKPKRINIYREYLSMKKCNKHQFSYQTSFGKFILCNGSCISI